jgi:type II secretory pathway component PulF
VQNALRMALAILEPSIIVFLGVVVGGIALTIFYTLYKMIMAIGGAH